jgi:ankyrin repeat domain-containing protein 50
MAVAESQQMGALLIGVERVTYLISRCRIYEILYLYSKQSGQAVAHLELAETSVELAVANLKSALVVLYAAMLRFLAMAIRLCEKSPGKRAIHGILNPDQVVSFVQECQTLETRVDNEASNCERTCSHTTREKLAGLQEPIMRTDSRVAALYDKLNETERLEILAWVSDIPYESNHYAARKGHTPGTGEWLLRHERYREWRGSSASMILWLHGIRKCRAIHPLLWFLLTMSISRCRKDQTRLYGRRRLAWQFRATSE